MTGARAGSIDLGSTRVKAALLDAEGRLAGLRSRPAPRLAGRGEVREGRAEAYAAVADSLLAWLARELPPAAPVGLASQRSTYVVWDRAAGAALSPLVSWQDRRAASWCERHAELRETVIERTGLVLSAHYAGPKLASEIERGAAWLDAARAGAARFGTLDAYLLARWTGGRVHETDLTMAARTAMLDVASGDWSDALLARYGVARAMLPRVRASVGFAVPLDGGLTLAASLADQAAGALTQLGEAESGVVINLGTGGFVLRQASEARERVPGYLTAPILGRAGVPPLFALEGSINGAGSTLDRLGPGPTPLGASDPAPDAFCLPDRAGLGAPFWRPAIGLSWSDGARGLDRAARRRVALEGLLFRIRLIVDDLRVSAGRLILTGGLAREPAVAEGLAALCGESVHVLEAGEAVLLGAARLAAGRPPREASPTVEVRPAAAGSYLPRKYERWRAWLDALLAGRG